MDTPHKNCHLVCGDDDYQVWLEAQRLIEALVPPESREFGLEVVDGRVETVADSLALFGRCEEALLTDSLFGGGDKLVWLREPAFLTIERQSRNEQIKKRLTAFAAHVKSGFPEGKRLLLTTPKINRGSALFKAFKAAGEVVDFGSNLKPKESEERARKFLDAQLALGDLEMSAPLKGQFISRVGTEARRIMSELAKLSCYCGKRRKVTSEDMEQIVSGGSATEIWPLLDAFGNREMRDTIKQLRLQLSQSESPIKLAAMLEGRLADLIVLREALDRKWASSGYQGVAWHDLPDDVSHWLDGQDRGMRSWHPFRLKNLAAQAGRWRLRQLRVARQVLLEMREKLVSTGLPQEWLLEVALLRALK